MWLIYYYYCSNFRFPSPLESSNLSILFYVFSGFAGPTKGTPLNFGNEIENIENFERYNLHFFIFHLINDILC